MAVGHAIFYVGIIKFVLLSNVRIRSVKRTLRRILLVILLIVWDRLSRFGTYRFRIQAIRALFWLYLRARFWSVWSIPLLENWSRAFVESLARWWRTTPSNIMSALIKKRVVCRFIYPRVCGSIKLCLRSSSRWCSRKSHFYLYFDLGFYFFTKLYVLRRILIMWNLEIQSFRNFIQIHLLICHRISVR